MIKPTLPPPAIAITDWGTANAILLDPKLRGAFQGTISIVSRANGHPGTLNKARSPLRLVFDDAESTSGFFTHGYVPVSPEDIRRIITYPAPSPLLVHCDVGVSRSTATAIILQAVKDGPGKEKQTWETFQALLKENNIKRYRGAQQPYPNRRMIRLADKILNRNNQLWRVVCQAMFPINPRYEDYELDG